MFTHKELWELQFASHRTTFPSTLNTTVSMILWGETTCIKCNLNIQLNVTSKSSLCNQFPHVQIPCAKLEPLSSTAHAVQEGTKSTGKAFEGHKGLQWSREEEKDDLYGWFSSHSTLEFSPMILTDGLTYLRQNFTFFIFLLLYPTFLPRQSTCGSQETFHVGEQSDRI